MKLSKTLQTFIVNNTTPTTRIKIVQTLSLKRFRRWYNFRITDYFIVSFPKCGRTWLRIMLIRAIAQHYKLNNVTNYMYTAQLANLHPDIPRISVMHDDLPQWKAPHELEVSKERYKNSHVVFLVRDPRDVIVSLFFQKSKRRRKYSGSMSEFLKEPMGGFDTILKYFNIWADNRQLPQKFMLMRYEDIHEDPQRELRRLLDFMGLTAISDETIYEAVQFASFDNMRKMETENQLQSNRLNPRDVNDPESFKTRKGKVGGYVDYLSEVEITFLNQKIDKDLSNFFGYKGS